MPPRRRPTIGSSASKSIHKWRSTSAKQDIYRPIHRNILQTYSGNQASCDQPQFALRSESSWWKWLRRKYLSHTDHIATFSRVLQQELPWWVNSVKDQDILEVSRSSKGIGEIKHLSQSKLQWNCWPISGFLCYAKMIITGESASNHSCLGGVPP